MAPGEGRRATSTSVRSGTIQAEGLSRRALENERGLPDRIRGADAEGMLAAMRAGEEAPPLTLPPPPSAELQHRLDVLAPLGAVLVAGRAAAVDLAPSLLATRDDIAAFLLGALRGDTDGAALGTGWRRELAGEALIELAEGRLALGVDATRPYLAEIRRSDPPEGG